MMSMSSKIPRVGVSPSHLTILIGKDRRKIVVAVKKDGLVIGRNSKKGKVDLDTMPFGGVEMGVSREHLLITPKRDFFIVKDLETANSTWHNRLRMRPMVAEELYHGDVLHLGELRLEIFYTYPEDSQAIQQTQIMNDLPKTEPFVNRDDLPATQPDTHQLKTPTQQSGAKRQVEDD
jgi:predicted component of type VI protein secretion system